MFKILGVNTNTDFFFNSTYLKLNNRKFLCSKKKKVLMLVEDFCVFAFLVVYFDAELHLILRVAELSGRRVQEVTL